MDDLYSINEAPPDVRSYVEDQFLLRVDQIANDALQCLLKSDLDLSDDLRSGWTRFIMSLLQRNPQKIAWLLENWKTQYECNIESSNPAVVGVQRLRMLQNVMDLPMTGDKINKMLWNVVTYEGATHHVLTSDRPVIMTNGLIKPDAHIIVPIGPERLFVAANTAELVDRLKAMPAKNLIRACNETVVWQSHTYVYADDDRQLRFVENRLGRGKPQLIVRDSDARNV